MIEKLEFYHGAALLRLIEDDRCTSVGRSQFGYVVNGDRTVLLKYTTKAHSPWRFTVTGDDLTRFDLAALQVDRCVLALVCGGDGVCAVCWQTARALLDGAAGWLAAKRGFRGSYDFSGSAGRLSRKVPLSSWPAIVFEEEE